MARIEIEGLTKSYGDHTIFAGLDITVEQGQFVCIVGPSGVGKTTLLRCLSGLIPCSTGTIRIGGRIVEGPPRELGLVFQDYSRSLLPWMTVLGNVMLPLEGKKLARSDARAAAIEALRAVGLADTEKRYPWQLSGGMQQRVAIARALAYRPQALIMDEPFASLDAQTRADLEDLMLDVQARFGISVLLVTHDIEEAIYLADKVVALRGTPATIGATLSIPLGVKRDQISTKSLPAFNELRAELLGLIRSRQPKENSA